MKKSNLKKKPPYDFDDNAMFYEFSLTKGKPIARIEGGQHDGELLRLTHTHKSSPSERSTEFHLHDPEAKLWPLDVTQVGGNPNRMVYAGSSLCGKSYLAGKIAEDYRAKNPKNRIYIISNLEEDDAYDSIPNTYRIPMDEDLIDDPINIKEMRDSLVIFDDYASHPDEKVVKTVEKLRDSAFNSGRHSKITPMSISQVLLDGKKSRDQLLNAFQVVLFPQSGGRYQANAFLEKYLSMPREKIDAINELPSRWVIINRVRPLYYIHERGAKFI
jgi:hypothetical protein